MFTENILSTFVTIADKFKDHNAFCIADKFYSYYEFAKCVSKIRKALQLSNTQSINVGLVANDDLESYAAIFAIWMEGLSYVPLHPHQPVERGMEIISQADIEIVINSGNNNIFTKVKNIESSNLKFSEFLLFPKPTADSGLAYILFTSGSTGKPKGVQISRGNVAAFMKSFWETSIILDEKDRCLQAFDLTFDVSVQCYLAPLTKGACVYTIPHDQIKYSYVYGLLENHKLTFSAMAPSMIRYLRPYFDEINIPSMRYNILTAEASPVDLATEWSKCLPNAEIFDFYGPTEATIYCTYYKYKNGVGNKQLNGMLSIGKAMPGMIAIIIDEEKNILLTNQKGELCISGDQLTPGYWKNPEKNKESFFELLYNGVQTRFYKTGDSCYMDDDGDLMLAGRLDYQVKIQGYRIELGEIEYHAREYLKGHNAVAVSFENKNGNTEIAMFIEDTTTKPGDVLEYLKSKLPYYMIPKEVIAKEKFPLNANGKVDRNLLKKLIII